MKPTYEELAAAFEKALTRISHKFEPFHLHPSGLLSDLALMPMSCGHCLFEGRLRLLGNLTKRTAALLPNFVNFYDEYWVYF